MVEPLSSREKILDVAESLFARRGYAGVGLREVALAAGLSKSSLFHHFRGKAPLYGEVLARVLTRIEERVSPVLRQPEGPAQRFERWISALIDHLAEHPTTARLLLRALFEDEEFASDPPAEAERAEAILASIVAGVQGLLREGMQQGVFRRVSVGHTLQTLIGATVYHFASAEIGETMLGRPLFSAESVAARKAEVIALLEHGIAAPTAPRTSS